MNINIAKSSVYCKAIIFSLLLMSSLVSRADSESSSNPVVRTVLGDSGATVTDSFNCTVDNGKTQAYGVKRYDVGAVKLAYVEGPDSGKPLVILPGMGVPWQSYIKAAELLCNDFHLFIITQRGHSITGWAKDRTYHVSDYGKDVTKLIREVIKEPVIISGHSLGGLVALWVASTQHDIVDGFNAEDGAYLINEERRWESSDIRKMFVGLEKRLRAYHEQGASIEEITEMFAESDTVLPSVHMSYEHRIMALGKTLSLNQKSGMPPLTDEDKKQVYVGYQKYLSGVTPKNREFWPQAVLKNAAISTLHLDPEVVHASVTTTLVADFDNRKAFSKVQAPMLYWESDREMLGIIEPSDHQNLVNEVQSNDFPTKYIYVDGSGHRIHFDRPKLFAEEIRSFFKNQTNE